MSQQPEITHAPARTVPPENYHLVIVGGSAAMLAPLERAVELGCKVAVVGINRSTAASGSISCAQAVPRWLSATEGLPFAATIHAWRLRQSEDGHASAHLHGRFEQLGAAVIQGDVAFTGPNTLRAGWRKLQFRSALVMRGLSRDETHIAGLREAGYLTPDQCATLPAPPAQLVVVGGGVAACALARRFRDWGSEVTLVCAAEELLADVIPAVGAAARQRLERAGVRLCIGWNCEQAEITGATKSVVIHCEGQRRKLLVDEIVLAADWRPHVADLDLPAAGVAFNAAGVYIDDCFKTTNPRIYAAGEACQQLLDRLGQDLAAQAALENALYASRRRLSELALMRHICCDPEVAAVGLTANHAAATRHAGAGTTCTQRVAFADRLDAADVPGGSVEVTVREGDGRWLGATIVGASAGEAIAQARLLLLGKLPLAALRGSPHDGPAMAALLQAIDPAQARVAASASKTGPAGNRPVRRWRDSLARAWFAWRR